MRNIATPGALNLVVRNAPKKRYLCLRHWFRFLFLFPMLLITVGTAYLYQQAMASAQGAQPVAEFGALDAYVDAKMKELHIPGLAIGIVQGDRIVHLKGFGSAGADGRAVTQQTSFVLGSTSKSFTALAIMQQVEAGAVALDVPVQHYLPWFRVADADASTRITVRHLLNHTSGLPGSADYEYLTSDDPSDGALEQRVRALRAVQLHLPVGTAYEYSNAGYATLGLIVQTVAGQSYGSYVREHIFAPLEMQHSFTSQAEAPAEGMARGHRPWFGFAMPSDGPVQRAQLPACCIISSAEDMAHYLIAYLNGGSYAGTSVLTSAGIEEMHRPGVAAKGTIAKIWKSDHYGMGWVIGEVGGVPIVWHGGDLSNFHSHIALAPQDGWGLVLLTNAGVAFPRVREIESGIVSLLLGQQPPVLQEDSRVQIALAIIAVVTALLLLAIVRSVLRFRRWQAQPADRPHRHGWLSLGRHIALPLVLYAAWALLLLVGLPQISGPLPLMLLYTPDLGNAVLISAVLALGWGVVRTIWVSLLLYRAATPLSVEPRLR